MDVIIFLGALLLIFSRFLVDKSSICTAIRL